MARRGAFTAILGLCVALAAGPVRAEEALRDLARAPVLSSTVGLASYYGRELDGRRTADGERFDMYGLSAAHKTLPLPCYARVTNLRNGRSIVVRVNDRGPYVRGRILDVSARAAALLEFGPFGVAKVRVDYLGKAGPAGAAEQKAMVASLRPNAADAPLAKAASVAQASEAPPLVRAALRTSEDGVTDVPRSAAPALAYAAGAAASKPAAEAEVALEHAVLTPAQAQPTSLASPLDAGLRRLETTLADGAAKAITIAKSPYGELVTGPFLAAPASP